MSAQWQALAWSIEHGLLRWGRCVMPTHGRPVLAWHLVDAPERGAEGLHYAFGSGVGLPDDAVELPDPVEAREWRRLRTGPPAPEPLPATTTVQIRQLAPDGALFGAGSWDNQVGKRFAVTMPNSGPSGWGVLRAAELVGAGEAVLLTIELDGPPAAALRSVPRE